VESDGDTRVREAGETSDTYTIHLSCAPTENVAVYIVEDSVALLGYHNVVVTPTPLTFTSENWFTPQTVTVTAIDDARDESCVDSCGGGFATLMHHTESADGAFNALYAYLHVHIADDDTAGVGERSGPDHDFSQHAGFRKRRLVSPNRDRNRGG
jgi:hypothetical protein